MTFLTQQAKLNSVLICILQIVQGIQSIVGEW